MTITTKSLQNKFMTSHQNAAQCYSKIFNPLKAELNPICHLLALLGGAIIVVISRLRVKYIFICIEVQTS